MDKIPAQIEAKKYFDEIAKQYKGKFILGGHSKGGNLAMYSTLHVKQEIFDRIKKVYCFDAPGISVDIDKTEEAMSNSTYLEDDDRYYPSGDSNKTKDDEKTKEKMTNLYKVSMPEWNSPAYVAAENQLEAVEKVAPFYEIDMPDRMSVEFVADVVV